MRTWISCVTLASSLVIVPTAGAATIVSFEGNSTGSLATGTGSFDLTAGTLTGSITNTSPDQALITGFGFDIGTGNLNGFVGTPNTITDPDDVLFTFGDGDLGNVPQFSGAELDFGYITGPNFTGGDPQDSLLPGGTVNFAITGPFGGLTEEEIAAGLFVRFQQVGPNGGGSDVATPMPPDGNVIPEPASMVLLGTGLAWLARRRMRQDAAI